MPLIEVTLIEGELSEAKKREMIEKVTNAITSVMGENLRPMTWVVIGEVKSGDWGVGGKAVTVEDAKALAAGKPAG